MSQTNHKILILLFFLFYFAAGLFASNAPTGEIYPFFSWFLFTKVPSSAQTEYDIRFLVKKDGALDPPLFFEEASSLYSETLHSPTEYLGIIQLLGESVAQRSEERVERYRQALEKGFLSHPITYELVSIRFDPIARWKDGTVQAVKPIRTFTSQN